MQTSITQQNDLALRFSEVRNQTERLCQPLAIEDYVVQTADVVSPPKWHLGHTTWLFENFILSEYKKGYRLFNKDFARVMNSYYNSVGDPYNKNFRGTLSRPTVDQIYQYRAYVNNELLELLDAADNELLDQLQPLIELGLQHEQQHQELLVYDIKHIFYHNLLRPIYPATKTNHQADKNPKSEWISYESGLDTFGHQGNGFAYDNEGPAHQHFLDSFSLNSHPILNGDWLEFIEAGGYLSPRYWLDNGWKASKLAKWEAPMYWEKDGKNWQVYTLSGMHAVNENEPVCHISFFEADAFARWKGLRLPTEWEWEKAAKNKSMEGNFMENDFLHPAPAKVSSTEFYHLFGDVWEWTQSAYLPYPGFKFINDGLGEYNGKFMNNQMVLRGGSCATSASHIRPTYRNFFSPESRWQFSGARLAKD